jgi:hypothetical protein
MLKSEILKQDRRGRVQVPAARREALLDEFEKSGASAAQFAQLAGIKYATFAGWMLKRRRQRGKAEKKPACSPDEESAAVVSAGPVRLLEALVEDNRAGGGEAMGARLLIELPGGSRMQVETPVQVRLAAELLAMIDQSVRNRC